jgi:hypothetical protein
MCGFYDDEQKIKKGDRAIFRGKNITIIDAKHIKENKTMDISYIVENEDKEHLLNIPYKTAGYDIELLERAGVN